VEISTDVAVLAAELARDVPSVYSSISSHSASRAGDDTRRHTGLLGRLLRFVGRALTNPGCLSWTWPGIRSSRRPVIPRRDQAIGVIVATGGQT